LYNLKSLYLLYFDGIGDLIKVYKIHSLQNNFHTDSALGSKVMNENIVIYLPSNQVEVAIVFVNE